MALKATMLLKTNHRPTAARRLARVGPWPKMAMPQAKMKDQSRQVIETKGSVSENKAVEWGAGDHIAVPDAAGRWRSVGPWPRMAVPQAKMKDQSQLDWGIEGLKD